MPTILDPELQCPLLHHGLVLLYPPEIAAVYATCVELRETGSGWMEIVNMSRRIRTGTSR